MYCRDRRVQGQEQIPLWWINGRSSCSSPPQKRLYFLWWCSPCCPYVQGNLH